MIPAKRNELLVKYFTPLLRWWLLKSFKKLKMCNGIQLKANHSILLLSNHFSWWDGFLGGYVSEYIFKKKYYVMIQDDQLAKRRFITYLGGFSVSKQSRKMIKSLQYAASLFEKPENAVAMFPQGALKSNHVNALEIESGVARVVKNVKGNCQIIYCSVLIDYFESFKPSAFFHLLDCGTNHDFELPGLAKKINDFHLQALQNQISINS